MTGTRLPSIARLADDGPVRAAAAQALTSELRMSLGVCPDRGGPIARRMLDRIVTVTQEARNA